MSFNLLFVNGFCNFKHKSVMANDDPCESWDTLDENLLNELIEEIQ